MSTKPFEKDTDFKINADWLTKTKDEISFENETERFDFKINADWLSSECNKYSPAAYENFENLDKDIKDDIIFNAFENIEASKIEPINDTDLHMLLSILKRKQELLKDCESDIKIVLVEEMFIENNECFRIKIDNEIVANYVSEEYVTAFIDGYKAGEKHNKKPVHK